VSGVSRARWDVEASAPIHDSIVRREGEIGCKTGESFAQRNEGDKKKLREKGLTGNTGELAE